MTRPSSRTRQPLGQHFLEPGWAARVVSAIAPAPGDAFLEIGPGLGALTLPLAATGVPILAVELDQRLADDLARRAPPHVTILRGDVLQTDVVPFLTGLIPQGGPGAAATRRRFRVAGNLPYYIASPIMFHLVEGYRRHGLFHDATVMLQREVADRVLAQPGTKSYGVLSILLSLHAAPARLLDLPPGAFRPKPKVHSSVVRLTFRPPPVRVVDEDLFERVVKQMFSQRRKTLANALKGFSPAAPDILRTCGLDVKRRPETLAIGEIAALVEQFRAVGTGPVL